MTIVRNFPAEEERVETGVVQFGDDWPGIFIRGDNAFAYGNWAELAMSRLEDEGDRYIKVSISSLKNLLRSCDVREIRKEDPDFV